MKKLYYITFNNCEGTFPQRDSESYDYNKIANEVKQLNTQLSKEGKYPWCSYGLGYKYVKEA